MKPLLFAIGLVLSSLGPAVAGPADGAFRLELRPGWREDGRHVAALHVHLAPGWKTYWRSPGEGGIPPQIEIAGHQVALHWPVPRVYNLGGMEAIGYKDEVVFPLLIKAPAPGAQNVQLRGIIGVCDDICIPVDISATLTLPGKGQYDPVIGRALKDAPKPAPAAGVRGAVCEVAPIRDGMRVVARITMPPLGRDEAVVLEPSEAQVWVSPSQVSRQGNTLVAQTDLVPPTGKPFALSRGGIRFTVLAEGRATTWVGCKAP